MWPWKKKSPAADGLEMIVNGQRSDDDGAAATAAAAAAAATPAPATDSAVVGEAAKPPKSVVVEKVYEHLIVFDLTGRRPFVKNADPDELTDEIARLDVCLLDNAFIASVLAQRVDCENLYENVGIGELLGRNDFERRRPDVHHFELPYERLEFVDEEEAQFLYDNVGRDVAEAVPAGTVPARAVAANTRADHADDLDDNSVICFRCSVPKGRCSIL